jgi:hypothetical protein
MASPARSSNRLLLLIFALVIPATTQASARGSACAYTPLAVWGQAGKPIADRLGVTPGVIYVFDPSAGSDAPGRAIPRSCGVADAKVSPGGDLVAFHGTLEENKTRRGDGVGVTDEYGTILVFVPGGETFAWSPRGGWLAVVVDGAPRTLAVWNCRTRSLKTYHVTPSRVGWSDEDALLLQMGHTVVALDPGSGSRSKTGHHGTLVSSDKRYSMWPGQDGLDTAIFDDETGADITARLFGPFRQRGLGEIRSAFWLKGEGTARLMCVSACDHVCGENPTCTTAIVDARTGETIVEFPGEALGPSGDGKTVILLRHSTYRMLGVNAEEMVRLLTSPRTFY